VEKPVVERSKAAVAVRDYVTQLRKTGITILPGANETFWVRHEVGAMMRMPTFSLATPNPRELNEALLRGRAACISYILAADEQHPRNAWLYVSSDNTYSLEKLGKGTKSSVRRGLKSLRVEPVDPDKLLERGLQAFCDTRKRVGLNDGTEKEFRRRFAQRGRLAGHAFVGAWCEDHLVAFLSMIDVDDWVEIEGSFSLSAFLKHYPNDTLLFSVLIDYLVKRAKRLVSYGLSSIQSDGSETGLHAFKTKIGFEAIAVHRVFVLHPLLRPFANSITRWGVNVGLRLFPGSRVLKKAGGVLASIGRQDGCAALFS